MCCNLVVSGLGLMAVVLLLPLPCCHVFANHSLWPQLWEEPSLNFSVWYTDKLNPAYQPIAQFTMMSLWGE
jgi:hypothetical protein